MSEPQRTPWTWDAYLDWEARQPVRYELVNGEVHAMAGGTLAHDTIAKPYYPLEELLAGITPENQPDEIFDDGPRGEDLL
jgi:Uma2 family endonuclease